MSKGDHYRPFDQAKWNEHFSRIFGEKELKTWNPEEDEDENVSDVSDLPDEGDDV